MPHPFDSVKFLQSWKMNKMNPCIQWWITTSEGYCICSSSQKVGEIPFFPNYATAVSSPTSKKPNCYSGMLHVCLTARLTWSLMWQSQGGRRCNMGSMKQKSMHPSKWIYCQVLVETTTATATTNKRETQKKTTNQPTTNRTTNQPTTTFSPAQKKQPRHMVCRPFPAGGIPWFSMISRICGSKPFGIFTNQTWIFFANSFWWFGVGGWGLGVGVGYLFVSISLVTSWDGKYELYL